MEFESGFVWTITFIICTWFQDPIERKWGQMPLRKKSSSRWQEDSGNNTDNKVQQIHLPNNMYHRHWHQIWTHFSHENRILDRYTYRLTSLQLWAISNHLNNIWEPCSSGLWLPITAVTLKTLEHDTKYYYMYEKYTEVLPEKTRVCGVKL